MPTIEQLYQRYKEEGLEVVAVNLDRPSSADVEAFVKEAPVTFRMALDPSASTMRAYRVGGIPTTYLIDRRGNAVVRVVGARDWNGGASRIAVQRLLHEQGTPAQR